DQVVDDCLHFGRRPAFFDVVMRSVLRGLPEVAAVRFDMNVAAVERVPVPIPFYSNEHCGLVPAAASGAVLFGLRYGDAEYIPDGTVPDVLVMDQRQAALDLLSNLEAAEKDAGRPVPEDVLRCGAVHVDIEFAPLREAACHGYETPDLLL